MPTYRRMAPAAFMGLLGLVLAGCLGSAAPGPNVDATVQARVDATVRALARTQPSPTRAPVGPTVVPIGSAPAGGTAIATPAAAAPAVTPVGTAGTPSPRPSTTPALGTPAPAGSALTPAATAAAPSSPSGALSFGTPARMGAFAVTVNRYEWGTTCPGSDGAAAVALPQGSKLVGIYATGRNDGTAAADVPALQWTFEGYPALGGAQSPCLQGGPASPGSPASPALVTSCLAGSRLLPDARCQGWVVFLVPEAMPVAGSIVRLQSPVAAQWRLPG